ISPRTSVNPRPSISVTLLLHWYVLLTSCGSGPAVEVEQKTTVPTVPVFFSHTRQVFRSVTVPSPLLTKRGEGTVAKSQVSPKGQYSLNAQAVAAVEQSPAGTQPPHAPIVQ